MVLGLVAILTPASLFGYGYSRDDDPLLKSFRKAVVSARKKDWKELEKATEEVTWQTDELATDFGIKFHAALVKAARAKSAKAAILKWANLVDLALRQKFYWNLKEKLADFPKSKARLAAARYYYDMVLAGNVKRFDKSRKTTLNKEIEALFDRARTELGRPAIIGTGSRAADPKAFRKSAAAILKRLDQVFPYFTRPEWSPGAAPRGGPAGRGEGGPRKTPDGDGR